MGSSGSSRGHGARTSGDQMKVRIGWVVAQLVYFAFASKRSCRFVKHHIECLGGIARLYRADVGVIDYVVDGVDGPCLQLPASGGFDGNA